MPLGWKVLQSYGDKIISNHRRYSYFTDSYRDTYWTIGVWQHVHGVIEPCRNGLHMSPTPAEAWSYVQGNILALVEGAGISVERSNTNNYTKSAHSQMRIIRAVALPRDKCNTAEVKFGRDSESFRHLWKGKLPETNAYLRQVFKELPAIKLVQQ